eukprot:TRINITY_DN9917_c0_g1_i1.p1 TRINITY_DN9917_c0_g1~~TRINITY_DN9917_c0_g1_i1.p1  ORF type:complete len:266 (+),score=15.46 TRINITY_DN9917_c0_g1_i1:63-860(+)
MFVLISAVVFASLNISSVLHEDLLETSARTLFINLERRPDRRLSTNNLLKKVGINAIRVNAVDGKSLSLEKCMAAIHPSHRHVFEAGHTLSIRDDREVAAFNQNVLTRGSIGCALSHRKCWKIVAKNHWDYALILEDDLNWIPTDINTRMQKVFTHLQVLPSWDIVLLSYHGTQETSTHPDAVHKTNRTWSGGLFTYLVSFNGALNLLNTWPLIYQLDLQIAHACHSGSLQCYRLSRDQVLSTSLLSESTLDSDVQVFEEAVQKT